LIFEYIAFTLLLEIGGNTMLYDTLYLLKDIVIVLLLFATFQSIRKVKDLERTLEEEKRKRTMPLINMEVNTDDDLGVFLINDSYCYAKNITIEDLDVVVDYGFKKHITLKFPPLEVLKPSARIKLNYNVFDDGYDITNTDSINILNHFSDAPIEMRLRYENIEGGPFAATIGTEKDKYIIKEITPLQE